MNVPKAWTGLLLFLTVSLCAQNAVGQGTPGMGLRKPFFERLRRLDEQFRRFQEMTLTQLQGIAENYNISYNIDARFQQLAEQQQNMSDSLMAFQASAASDLSSLKLWTKKLQKKTERLDLKVSELEQTLEESSKRGPSPGESPEDQGARISNVTQELQEHRARLDDITANRAEVRGGLRELRDSLGKQESRMAQLEEQVRSVLQQGHAFPAGAREDNIESNLTPQDLGPRAMTTARGYESPKTSAKLLMKHSKGKKAKEGLIEEPKELWEMPHQQEELRDMLDLPQLPLRHKIPRHQHASKNTGTTCNVKSALNFPSASTQNYVTFRKGLAAGIHELSICTWLKVREGTGYIGTLLSYATEDNDNKLVLYGRNSTRRGSLDLVIGDPVYRELPVDGVLDGHWHHLCVVWSSIEGRFWHYTDRRLTSTGSRFRKGYEIPSGGAVVLGQEQDAVGGGFDEAEAFVGELAGFAMWARALSPGEVSAVATGRSLPRGAILTLDDIDQPNGNVQLVHCDCLEHCF
ncbi:hypothetical protein SKAU_G00292630 [Synaphobranchus kaupii]|uniref:Pentraxin (PTX) domain-containing protein n=1 Tax=Synaphobranchus kaupii TaxID=118154 RepID=A0A9Q1IKB9_SYNKA|nr:hypothetical protein SKAU_G00292630 [Synaphobranchus kaupii]